MKQTVRLLAGSLAMLAGCSSSVVTVPGSGSSGSGGQVFADLGPRPEFGPVVIQPSAPPPISGGTLTIAQDGRTAVAADPDRDAVYVVDLRAKELRLVVPLPHGSEPGRVAIEANNGYVALRGTDAVAVIDLTFGTLSIHDACRAPRGITIGRDPGTVLVACASGDLVTLDIDANTIRSRVHVGPDLRDVLPPYADGTLRVSTFRSAKLLKVVEGTAAPPAITMDGGTLAWRVITAGSGGDPAMVSQEPTTQPIPGPSQAAGVAESETSYGGVTHQSSTVSDDCSVKSVTTTQLTVAGVGTVTLPTAVLPVDLASNGDDFAVVAAGNAFTGGKLQIYLVNRGDILRKHGDCVEAFQRGVEGQAIAAAYGESGMLVVQTREPAALHILYRQGILPGETIPLSNESRFDTGHAIFHSTTGSFVACASCHAEGADDGRVWNFEVEGLRRTPSLLGTIQETAPYHWGGDIRDIRALVDDVFIGRMHGPKLDNPKTSALEGWLFKLPPPAPLHARDDAAERGATIFADRCVGCHAGPRFTNNGNYDVGTGGKFQVPSLRGVGWRAPFLHDGCAQTLQERFQPQCGSNSHASGGLTEGAIKDLTAFLESL